METKRTARVLIRRETATDGAPWYVAQVLEYDLATQAKSVDAVVVEIERMIVAHIVCCEQESIAPFSVPPAPKTYLDEYVASKATWTVDITRGKSDQPMAPTFPALEFRFATGS